MKIFDKMRSMFGFKDNPSLKDSITEVIEEHNASGEAIDQDEKVMLHNVLTFNELAVEDVMIPRADIIAVNHDIKFDELKKLLLEKTHTRIPVYRKTLDDIVGFIHIKDLINIVCDDKPFNIDKIIRQALFVPPSMKTSVLLVRMQFSRVHIAMVVDEYGGISGLVTMENLMEEIVGEIEDEHDVTDDKIFTKVKKGLFEVNARIPIEELEEKLGRKIVDRQEMEDFDTLGGLIFYIIGRVPSVGELISYQQENSQIELEFEIIEADPRRIKRVLIRKK